MTGRRERMVFVDPEDPTLAYWWPALVVPQEEYELFRETMDSDITQVRADESLVCYFEDGSFSVVPKTALIPFSPEKEPYRSYHRNIKRFRVDRAVRMAVEYWQTGVIPALFKWLNLLEHGYCEKELAPLNSNISGSLQQLDQEEGANEEQLGEYKDTNMVQNTLGKRRKIPGRPPKIAGKALLKRSHTSSSSTTFPKSETASASNKKSATSTLRSSSKASKSTLTSNEKIGIPPQADSMTTNTLRARRNSPSPLPFDDIREVLKFRVIGSLLPVPLSMRYD